MKNLCEANLIFHQNISRSDIFITILPGNCQHITHQSEALRRFTPAQIHFFASNRFG